MFVLNNWEMTKWTYIVITFKVNFCEMYKFWPLVASRSEHFSFDINCLKSFLRPGMLTSARKDERNHKFEIKKNKISVGQNSFKIWKHRNVDIDDEKIVHKCHLGILSVSASLIWATPGVINVDYNMASVSLLNCH